MDERARILLLDDGELEPVAEVLDFLGESFDRLQGAQIGAAVPSPHSLLVTSALRGVSLPFLSRPEGSAEPTWLVVHCADQEAGLRRDLRDVGAHFVARSDLDDESLRLLLQQLIYRGDERRTERRLPTDERVLLELPDGQERATKLVDRTRQAVRAQPVDGLNAGDLVVLHGGAPQEDAVSGLSVPAVVVRSDANALVLRFEACDADTRSRLDALFHELETRSPVEPLAREPDRSGSETLDAARPAIVDPVAEIPDWDSLAAQAERRGSLREPYEAAVMAFPNSGEEAAPQGEAVTCIGHDLSTEGICLLGLRDVAVGTRLSLALHGGRRVEPLVVQAEVRRCDDSSTGLAFVDTDGRTRRRIAQLLGGQPPLESLIDGHVQPVVLSRVLEENSPH